MKKVTVTSTTGRESDKFMLRLPDGMRERIAEAAKINNRSMNSEIVARLQDSFDLLMIEGRAVHKNSIELVEADKLEKIVTDVAERTAAEYRLALAEALRSFPSTADRTALIQGLTSSAPSPGREESPAMAKLRALASKKTRPKR